MSRRLVPLVLPALLLAGVLVVPAAAAPTDAKVGDVRAVLPRRATPLRERPSYFAKAVDALPHGTRVRIDEVLAGGGWVRVSAQKSETTPIEQGWLKAGETVEPMALTQGGAAGAVAAPEGGPTQAEISAAGRQFDEGTEQSYRATHAAMSHAYDLLDRIEADDPAPSDVAEFLRAGGLGRPGRGR
jgi:hypothetical protein